MKQLLIILFLGFAPVSAQLFPISDFYIFDGLIINPAFAGSHDALSATLQYRNQWVAFKDAPQNSIFSAHAPFFNDRIGLGLLLARSSFGVYNETSFMGNYAYRMNLHTGKLALGLAFGLKSYRVSWDDLKAFDPDDLLLSDNSSLSIVPDFSLGAYYYGRNYFAGFSIPFFLSYGHDKKTGKLKAKNQFNSYDYFFTGGYTFNLNRIINLEPSVLLMYNQHAGIQGDLYLKTEFYDRFSMGAGVRSIGMFIGFLSCNINRQLTVSYSFDTDSGKAGRYRKGSHEIMISYIFRYSRNVMSPAEI